MELSQVRDVVEKGMRDMGIDVARVDLTQGDGCIEARVTCPDGFGVGMTITSHDLAFGSLSLRERVHNAANTLLYAGL